MNKNIRDKFFSDPDWKFVDNSIKEYLEPIRDVLTIDTSMSAESVLAEVRARQLTVQRLESYLNDVGMISGSLKTQTPFR